MSTEQKHLKKRIMDFQFDLMDSGIEIARDTEGYGYNYTDLPKLLAIITPFLRKHGIWYSHETSYSKENNCNIVTTEIFNVDNINETKTCLSLINNEAILGGMNRFQVEGSGITYFRRYHIVTLLGLTTEEDTDAAGKRKAKDKSTAADKKSEHVTTKDVDFIDTFKSLIEKKRPVDKIRNVLNMYKEQINNEDLKTINQLISDYENKS